MKTTYEVRLNMATLTLKRSKPVGDRPLIELTDKFIVMRQPRDAKSFRFTAFHPTKDSASQEAKRLMKVVPTERYVVLQVVDIQDWGQE